MKLSVYLQSVTTSSMTVPTRQQFKHWVEQALTAGIDFKKTHRVEITIRLVDEAESAELNYKYRHKNNPTNILSFPAERIPRKPFSYLGDLIICAPLVSQEADEQKKTVIAHWAHLTIHGVLHLLGYDHKQEGEATIMEAIEIDILKSLGFNNPYTILNS